MTGKFELEYEGELKGADQIARDLVRAAVANVFDGYFGNADVQQVTDWFDMGGSLSLSDTTGASTLLQEAAAVQGLIDLSHQAGVNADGSPPSIAAAVDFVLEGLYAHKKISRNDGRGYHGVAPVRRPQPTPSKSFVTQEDEDEDTDLLRRKKKYYN
jgi:magnesium chelatase subunit I